MRLRLRGSLAHFRKPRLHIGDRRRSRLDLAGERITDYRLRTHQRNRRVRGDLVACGTCIGGALHSSCRCLRSIERSLLELRHATARGDRLHCGIRVEGERLQSVDLGSRARDCGARGVKGSASGRELVRQARKRCCLG